MDISTIQVPKLSGVGTYTFGSSAQSASSGGGGFGGGGGGGRPDSAEESSLLPTSSLAVDNDRKWAEEQAQKQMNYQERMSNTAYQRAVADLKAAGLNPGLAYSQGGASAPVGSIANTGSTVQTAAVTRENNLVKLLNTALGGLLKLANSALLAK